MAKVITNSDVFYASLNPEKLAKLINDFSDKLEELEARIVVLEDVEQG